MLGALALFGTIQIVDILPGLYEAEAVEPTAARVARFKSDVLEPNRTLFAGTGIVLNDAQLGAYLNAVDPQLPAVHAMEQTLEQSVPAIAGSFGSAFPKFRPQSVVIYLTPSLGSFDGMTQDVEGHHSLLLGVDNIAAEHAHSAYSSITKCSTSITTT